MTGLKLPDRIVVNGVDLIKSEKRPELLLSYAIALWYNGVPFLINDTLNHIGCSPPPKLRTLIGCSKKRWDKEYEPVLKRFQKVGNIKEETILRRKVRWSPQKKYRRTLGEAFGQVMIDHGLQSSINESVGLVGDWNESLRHRMGVERLQTIHMRADHSVTPYPDVTNKVAPDIYWRSVDSVEVVGTSVETKFDTWGGEVITNHNNYKMLARKYKSFASNPDCKYIWVFDDRHHAANALNQLDYGEKQGCSLIHAPYSRPWNYSIKTLNEYITRSQNNPDYECAGIDQVTTLTALQDQISTSDGSHQSLYPLTETSPVRVN
jgi:hypothetical protein